MNSDLAQTAISLALKSNWKEAIEVNKGILKLNEDDVDALNRLAKAYIEIGDIKKAKLQSEKVLKIDKNNKIAARALERCKTLKKTDIKNGSRTIDPSIFIEEPGRTKLTNLINLASGEIISNLNSGDEVSLSTHSHRVTVTTVGGVYVGKLPDDLSARIRQLAEEGNIYKAYVKSIEKNCLKVFIKEIKRSKSLMNVHSFPADKSESLTEFPA